jgi:chromosome segregation ATPase
LFQQKDFWRVVKSKSDKQAEATYRAFVAQSAELAEVDIKRIKMQAEYAHAEKLLASRSAELSTLQADRAVRLQQEEQVAARQEQSRQEATALADQQKDVRQQLRDLQRQIDALQAQQAQVGNPAAQNRGK